jgi:hypothetical protein
LDFGFFWLISRGRYAVSVDLDTSYLAFCRVVMPYQLSGLTWVLSTFSFQACRTDQAWILWITCLYSMKNSSTASFVHLLVELSTDGRTTSVSLLLMMSKRTPPYQYCRTSVIALSTRQGCGEMRRTTTDAVSSSRWWYS